MKEISDFKWIVISVVFQVIGTMSMCVPPRPDEETISEDEGEGGVIFASNNADDTLYTFNLPAQAGHPTGYYNQFFAIIKHVETWQFEVKKPVDLEIIRAGDSERLSLNVLITCTNLEMDGSILLPLEQEFYQKRFHIIPVDEFQPELLQFFFNVREDAGMKDPVVRLANYIRDFDYPSNVNAFNFSMTEYAGMLSEGSKVFRIAKNGDIFLKRKLDYEKGDISFGLFVSNYDMNKINIQENLDLWILNIDDNPPIFYEMSCSGNCSTKHYAAHINNYFKGIISNYSFGPIQAIDADLDKIMYSLTADSVIGYGNFVRINETSAQVGVIAPILSNETTVNVTIKAKSMSILLKPVNSNTSNQAEASLIIYITHITGVVNEKTDMAVSCAQSRTFSLLHLPLTLIMVVVSICFLRPAGFWARSFI